METYNPVAERKASRREALMWWISLRGQKKVILSNHHYPKRKYYMLNGREIEAIWEIEDIMD